MRRYFNLIKNLSNWWLYLAVKYAIRDDEPVVFRTRKGVLVEVPRRLLQTFKEIFMDECYFRGMKLPSALDPVVIDVGANAGFFTLYAISEMPGARVFSYEPIPVNFKQLKRNLGLNLGFPAYCFQQAVTKESGTINLSYDPDDEFTTSATIRKSQAENDATITVSSISLSDIFHENHLEKCDLLKMDCEGAEFEILYNCPVEIMAVIQSMALEVHRGPEPEQNIDSLETYLKSTGFSTCQRPVGMLWAWR